MSFFENVPYYHSCYIHDLSFLDTTTSTKSFTSLVLTYTPSLSISIPALHDSLTKFFLSFVNVTTTDILLLLTALTSRGYQLSCRNSPRDCHPLARYCVFVNATYSLEFSSFVFAHHSLQEPKSYSEDVKSLEWQHAMNEKLAVFQFTHTWDLVRCRLVQL